jgi:hypothetical protein
MTKNHNITRIGYGGSVRVPMRPKIKTHSIPWPSEPTPEVVPPEAVEAEVVEAETATPTAKVRDTANIPPAVPEPWTDFASEGTISPEEWDDRQESPAAARLRKRAAELRTGKPAESPDTRGLPTNEPRPCDRCGNADLTPTPCRLGTRWECFAPTCRIAGDRARTWWLGRTIWVEGKEADA